MNIYMCSSCKIWVIQLSTWLMAPLVLLLIEILPRNKIIERKSKITWSYLTSNPYQFDEDKHHYIYRKVNELDFHPFLRLGEVCGRIQQSNSHTPCPPKAELLSCFLLSSSPTNQQLHFRVLPSRWDTALIPTTKRKRLPLKYLKNILVNYIIELNYLKSSSDLTRWYMHAHTQDKITYMGWDLPLSHS